MVYMFIRAIIMAQSGPTTYHYVYFVRVVSESINVRVVSESLNKT